MKKFFVLIVLVLLTGCTTVQVTPQPQQANPELRQLAEGIQSALQQIDQKFKAVDKKISTLEEKKIDPKIENAFAKLAENK